MTLDPRARRFLKLLSGAATPGSARGDPEEFRRATAALVDFAPMPPGVTRHDETLRAGAFDLPLRVYEPGGETSTLPGLVWFHGGGLVSGDLDTHDRLCSAFAALAACRVLSVGYRLAPEFRFPAAQEDAEAALRAIGAEPERWKIDPRRLGVGGDSAGAALAAVATQAATQAGNQPTLLLMLCPALDPLPLTPSRKRLAVGYLIDEATLRSYWELTRSEGVTPDDPRMAPRRAKPAPGWPPTFVHTAEYDPLCDEGEAFAAGLSAAGASVRVTRHAGLVHPVYGLGAIIPAGQRGLERICAELKAAFASV